MISGISIFPTTETLPPGDLGALVEQWAFESLWFPEHTHFPVSRESAYTGGGEMPREYTLTLDPFVALSAAAMTTTSLRLGTGICILTERDPITTAKSVASLDVISGGRVEFGVGAGWNREEMMNHGTDPRTRMQLLVERVEAMKAIWTKDEAEYHGDFVDFAPLWMWPKPIQAPHPPVLIGGNGPGVLDRVVRCGDAWFPSLVSGSDAEFAKRIQELNAKADAAGRGPIPVTVNAAPMDARRLAWYSEIGVHRVVFMVPNANRTGLESQLEAIVSVLTEAGLR